MRVIITIDRTQGEKIADRIEVPIGAELRDTLYKKDGTYEEIRSIAKEINHNLCIGCAYLNAEENGNTCSHIRCTAKSRKDEKETILSKIPTKKTKEK